MATKTATRTRKAPARKAAAPAPEIVWAELLEQVWRLPANRVQTRTIDMLMARLREKLRDDPALPRVIQTVRGKGYVWL